MSSYKIEKRLQEELRLSIMLDKYPEMKWFVGLKDGDRVVCINDKEIAYDEIQNGKVYTVYGEGFSWGRHYVMNVELPIIYLKSLDGRDLGAFWPHFFRKVNNKNKMRGDYA